MAGAGGLGGSVDVAVEASITAAQYDPTDVDPPRGLSFAASMGGLGGLGGDADAFGYAGRGAMEARLPMFPCNRAA